MRLIAEFKDSVTGLEVKLEFCGYGECYYVSTFKRVNGTTSTETYVTEKVAHQAFLNEIDWEI